MCCTVAGLNDVGAHRLLWMTTIESARAADLRRVQNHARVVGKEVLVPGDEWPRVEAILPVVLVHDVHVVGVE